MTTAQIDFAQPLEPAAPRLRHRFAAPRERLIARDLSEVRDVLQAVHAAAQQGHWCVGYVRYEAAPAFDRALQVHAPDGPLAWFAVYDAPQPEAQDSGRVAVASAAHQIRWQGGHDRAVFDAALARIHTAIRDGELYQVNYTAPLLGQLEGSPDALFAALQRAQPGGYAAHIDAGGEQVLSVSPELFFDWRDGLEGGEILARPMKGTAPRGATPEPVRLRLADRAFEAAHSEFVRHKTTRREHYAEFAPTEPGVFDTVLWNEAGEITETTFGNIAARIDGRWITPPLSSGLLPGVGRAVALREERVVEAVLRVEDVPRVQEWAFVNSLRGWLAATLDPNS